MSFISICKKMAPRCIPALNSLRLYGNSGQVMDSKGKTLGKRLYSTNFIYLAVLESNESCSQFSIHWSSICGGKLAGKCMENQKGDWTLSSKAKSFSSVS